MATPKKFNYTQEAVDIIRALMQCERRTIYNNFEPLQHCCGVRQVGLYNLMYKLCMYDINTLKNQLTYIMRELMPIKTGEGNILFFTSSYDESDPAHVQIIEQLATTNVDLGVNPITGSTIKAHFVHLDNVLAKIETLKF